MTYADEYQRLLCRTYDGVYSVLRNPSGDVEFYVEQAQESGGPVLELGCGTGRILIPTARAGVECVGLDGSPEMLAVLREKSPPANVQLVQGLLESFDLGERRFRLISAPFRVLQHLLDIDVQLAALSNVRRHLAPGGAFVFDVFDPKLERMAQTLVPESEGQAFTYEGHSMRRFDSIRTDLSSQVMSVTFRYEGGPEELQGTSEVKMRWYYRYELEHLLKRAGFSDLTFYRDFAKTPWSSGGEIIIVARSA
jgi:ubiquinone/menaquinone biosynthesis C-methylase UbiE